MKKMTSWYDLIKRLRQKYGDEYEWLVARHMWRVITRRLAGGRAGYNIPEWKDEITRRYQVEWAGHCWLCDHFQFCPSCPLKTCVVGSAYCTASFGDTVEKRVAAARHIEEVIYAVRDKM